MARKNNLGKKANTNGFAQNPENINRTGANRKTYSAIIKKYKQKGISPPTKAEYYDAIGCFLSMTEKELKDFVKEVENPYWLRIIAIELNQKTTRAKVMQDYRDWLFGKATQLVGLNHNVQTQNREIPKVNIILTKPKNKKNE